MLDWRLITTIYVDGGVKKWRELMKQVIDYGFDVLLYPGKYSAFSLK